MVTNLTDDVKAALLAKIPLGRFGKPEEVAAITRFLCTEGGYVTGAQININMVRNAVALPPPLPGEDGRRKTRGREAGV
jgi:NAD(P)-dependent dehydrogenase (short-subunit alcohol dehydrogenase family)